MTAPVLVPAEIVAAVRDAALADLGLSDAKAVERVDRAARTVLGLIADRLGLTVFYGLATIPGPVLEAATVAAGEWYRRKDAPFGVMGAWSESGESFRVARDPLAGVEHLLAPYRAGWGIA